MDKLNAVLPRASAFTCVMTTVKKDNNNAEPIANAVHEGKGTETEGIPPPSSVCVSGYCGRKCLWTAACV